jgi:ABC-type branched-subunit amino acid transport system permease subunit
LLAGAAVALPLSTTNTYYLYLACSALLLTIVTAGLNVLAGLTGQISLGHAGFYALGAYGAALGATRLGWTSWLAASAGVIVAAGVGAVVAAAALRVSGPYLAMVTIAFGIIVESVLVEWVSVTGGPGGIFNIPKLPLGRYYWVIAASAAVALWLAANLRRSAWGRAFLAVKGSEVAAESLGLSAYYVRIVAFTVSAAFTGAAGALFSGLNGYISPDSFTLQTSILFLLALLFGGMGSVAGPVVGSLALTVLPELSPASRITASSSTGLLCSIYWLLTASRGSARRRGSPPCPSPPRPRERPARRRRPLRPADGGARPLLAEGVAVSFGASLPRWRESRRGENGIFAVIGPNGAGKTTLLNAVGLLPTGGARDARGYHGGGRSPPRSPAPAWRARSRPPVFRRLPSPRTSPSASPPWLGALTPVLLVTPPLAAASGDTRPRATPGRDYGLGEYDHPADALPAG